MCVGSSTGSNWSLSFLVSCAKVKGNSPFSCLYTLEHSIIFCGAIPIEGVWSSNLSMGSSSSNSCKPSMLTRVKNITTEQWWPLFELSAVPWKIWHSNLLFTGLHSGLSILQHLKLNVCLHCGIVLFSCQYLQTRFGLTLCLICHYPCGSSTPGRVPGAGVITSSMSPWPCPGGTNCCSGFSFRFSSFTSSET